MWSRLLDRSQTGCQQLNLRIQLARRPQGKKAPTKLDVSKLNQHSKRQALITDICNHLGEVQLSSEDPEENWTVFRNAVHSLAVDTLGYSSRKQQDWFDENDEEIQVLLEENTRHIKLILAQFPRGQPTTTINYCKTESRADSRTCKIPG